MPSLISIVEAKAKAEAELIEDDFKKEVAKWKVIIAARKQHLLPFKVTFQWPIKLVEWANVKPN